MSFLTDMDQNDRLSRLESRLRRLEGRNGKGEDQMSRLIKELVGMECTIDGDDFFNSRCTVIDADDEWIKVTVHDKKKDYTKIVRIDTIDNITLD
ncbi:hypothetical protein [Ruminococcus sp. Marseille-P6503]|uniref:hypothetical protein n=1 Tax=Ruminococcus sp. Marseille-P6503 TaxID=2364796 RepID=UPI000F54B778|nr:hypothetical protein [Ruminococcus sp. Marseille-P6503]